MSFFISDVMAAGTAAHAQGDGIYSFVMIGGIFALFYFMLIRPQNKRAKEHRALINQLKKGDEVMTAGGFQAKVNAVEDQILKVNIAEGVEISLQRSSVTAILPKGTITFI